MKIGYSILAILLFTNVYTYSQKKYTDVVPPSPNAAAIAKFGDIPVSMFSGTPSIDIPFFEVGIKNVKVPIGISYHAGGIKVGEDASNIGIGWALNAGGSITRTVRGLPDEDPDFGYLKHNVDLSTLPNTIEAQRLLYNKIQIEELDADPDSYSFNFLGRSGKFIVKKINSSSFECYPIDGSNLKIQWMLLAPTNNRFQWIITDEEGTRYFFGESLDGGSANRACETSESKSITYSTSRGGRSEPKGTGAQRLFPTAWQLKQIILTNGEQISFTYLDYTTNTCGFSNEFNVYCYGNAEECGNYSVNRTTINQTLVNGKKIYSIVFNNGRVDFTYSGIPREDLININSNTPSNDGYLDRVTLSTLGGETIKSFELSHSYFNLSSYHNQFVVDCDKPKKGKLRLDKVQEFGKNNVSVNPYVFTYEGADLPYSLSYAQDHWGFYNGQNTNTTLIPEYLIALPQNNLEILAGAKRFSDFNFAKKGIITNIKYPTGGQSFFNYESHKAWASDFGFEINTAADCIDNITLSRSDVPSTGPMTATKPLVVNGTQCYNNQQGDWYEFNTYTPTPCKWNQRGEGGCNTNFILSFGSTNYSLNGLTDNKKFLANGTYSLKIQVRDPDYSPADISLEVCKIAQSSSFTGNPNPSEYNSGNFGTLCSGGGQPYNKIIGGLRIESIVNKDNTNVTSVTKYVYLNVGTNQSSGNLVQKPIYAHVSENLIGLDNGENNLCLEFNRSSFSQMPLFADNGNHVEYTYVEEIKTANEVATTGIRTAYIYNTEQVSELSFPFARPDTYPMRRGKLLEQKDFSYINSNYKLVKSNSIIYTKGDTRHKPGNPGLKIGCVANSNIGLNTGCSVFVFGQSKDEVDWTYVTEKKEKIYDPTDETKFVVTRDRYTYNNAEYRQLSVLKRIDGKSKLMDAVTDTYDREIITSYKYTFDYPSSEINTEMKDRNILALVEEKVELNDGINTKMLTLSNTTFNKWHKEKNYAGLNGFFAPNYVKTWLEETSYENLSKNLELTEYDQFGNLNEYKENNNAMVSMDYYLDAGKKNLLRTQTIGSGTSTPQATTYDYFPLIGVSSVIQPSGLKTSYEYDNLGRLQYIKDNEGRLVKSYKYNYATPTSSAGTPPLNFTGQLDVKNREINLSFSYATPEVVKYEIRRGQGSEPLKLWVTVPGNSTTKIDPSYTPQQNVYKYEIRAILSNGTATEWKPLNIMLPANCTNNFQLIKNGLISAGQVKVDKACYEIIFEEGFITEDNADYTAEIETP
ncbi:RHS repeat protein [Emticicia agri]|uniref:RHS repeat protein n=1 Tax=Emticicia agri TaxID=2492393 RepID=A0A4V1ZD31_9BACT|nr:RHS repeat protein [Emticicia agri]RYU94740.1 RHS repeat protein [Emticicia agri]